MQEILTALEQRHDLPDEALCALLETDAMDGALFHVFPYKTDRRNEDKKPLHALYTLPHPVHSIYAS